jgi:hypothetical protein
MTEQHPEFSALQSFVPSKKTWLTAGGVLVAVVVWLLTEPLTQNPLYHDFADQRALLGIPHALNVLSNAAFSLAGLWGLLLVAKRTTGRSLLDVTYLVFFLGLFFTGLGSAYSHLSPYNTTLVWDRLPMTVGFMAFTTLVIAERYSEFLARRLFPWLLAAGFLSVAYWGWHDDLRPYFVIQFGPMLILPVIIWRCSGPGTRWLWLTVACYFAAKLLEVCDQQVLMLTEGLVGGHTLKHLAAAAGAAMIAVKVKQHPL